MTTPYEEGNPDAKILFLAEAPASVEERLGRPLVGPSGDIFNDCLHSAGLIRHNSYILNVWPFQVTKDKAGNMYKRVHGDQLGPMVFKKNREFTEYGMEQAKATLARIAASKANLVVTMGAPAMALATGDKRPITKWRGSLLWSERFGKKVLPTIHPAATLHGTYLWRYIIMADYAKAKEQMKSPLLELPQRKFILDPTFEDVMEYIDLCLTKPRIATDIEVINHQLNCFCLVHQPMEAMVVPMADEFGNAWWNEAEEIAIWKGYARIMGDPNIMKINQNIVGFDSVFLLLQNNIFTYGEIGDTMIAQHVMYPEFKKGLDFICSIRTNEPYYKDEGKMWKGVGGDIRQFWVYNGKDGCVAMEAWDDLAAEMTEKGYWETYRECADLMRVIAYMSIRGFRVDHARLEQTHKDVAAKLLEKENELTQVARYPFNVSSPKQCQLYFYGTLGYTPYHNREGGVTTDDKAMARIYRRYNCAEAKLVQEIRALRKLKGTYLEMSFDADARMRCSWNPRGTKFGRLSSEKTIFGTGANQQNLHPEFKHFLVADEEPLQ